jgi:multiple sugar transport system permease protein
MTNRKTVPYILLIPIFLYFALFLAYPLYQVTQNSFFNMSMLNPFYRTWAGLDNYIWLFNSINLFSIGSNYSYFIQSLLTTIPWLIGSVSLKVVFGLLGALLLNSEFLMGKKVYRALVIVPWAIPWALAAMMWKWTLNGQFGIVNSLLFSLHIINTPISFLSTPISAFITTFITDAWAGLPFMIIMILSGLQSIPEELYEAATLDGANDFKKLYKITLPSLKTVLLTVSLLSVVWTFNSFDFIWVLTGGGPVNSTTTLPIAIYNVSFGDVGISGGIGKASAMTIVQVIIVSIISVFYVKTLGSGEE